MSYGARHRFYKSKEWKQCREEYARSVGYLCERCLKKGIITPGEIVHHTIHLTPLNVYDPEITLNPEHLQMLCRKCHGEVHAPSKQGIRYTIGADGSVNVDDDE